MVIMSSLLGLTTALVDVYNGKIEDLGLSPFFRVDKGWRDNEDEDDEVHDMILII